MLIKSDTKIEKDIASVLGRLWNIIVSRFETGEEVRIILF